LNRVEVLERMEPILNTQVRTMEHNPRTRVVVTPDMVTLRPGSGQRHLEMTTGGAQSMANFVGLPWNLAAKLHPNTFGAVATELLARKQRYALMIKEGAVTAVAKPTEYHSLSPARVLSAIEKGINGIEYNRLLILDNFVACLELIGEKREPVVRGDLIQAGAQVTFSPIGTIDPVVQSFALRLICTNGMTSNTILREFHYGDGGSGGEGDDIWQWFRRASKEAYDSLDRIVARYRQMADEQIPPEQRALMLEAMLRDAKITGDDANAVRAMAIENPPETTYALMNLISNATSHLLEDPNRIRRAQNTVASFTSEEGHSRLCPVCHSRRN